MSESEKNMPEPEKNTLETEAEISKEISEVGEKVVKWNAVKISKFVEWIKKKLNIQEQAVIQTTATAQESEKPEEKSSNVSVKLIEIKDAGLSPIKVYGAIKDAVKELKGEDINIIQAKKTYWKRR